VWIFIASVLSNAVLGFLVAFFQSKNQWSLLATAIVFGILFIASLSTAIWLRHRLRTKSRVIKLQAMQTLGSIE
jgi:Na+/melibiose symporter-like transporter